MHIEKRQYSSYIIFFITISIVAVYQISIFFPALIGSMDSSFIDKPFELGIWAIPTLVTYIILFGIGILYYKKRLPNTILNKIKFILNFEVSKKIAVIIIIILLGSYVILSFEKGDIFEPETWPDFESIMFLIENYPSLEQESVTSLKYEPNKKIGEETKFVYVKNFLLYLSYQIFDNVKVLPFIASISLLLLTYFFTYQISQRRFAGIISLVILLQSFTFLRYSDSATYAYFWIVFYLLSLYLIHKKWYLSPISYLLSIFSKPITLIFLPMTIFFIYRSKLPKRKKITVTIYSTIIIFIIGAIILADPELTDRFDELNLQQFISSFTLFPSQLRFDGLMLVFLLPLTIGLFLKSLKSNSQADGILILIMGVLILYPLMQAITDYNIQPYRFIALITFFAIGVGVLFSKKITQ